MDGWTRRGWIGAAAAGALWADPLNLAVGVSAYPLRHLLAKDLAGTLKLLKTIGYRNLEWCSPQGFAQAGFAPLAGLPVADFKRQLQANGLKCESCLYRFSELRGDAAAVLAAAAQLGVAQIVVAGFELGREASLADWARACDQLNRVADQAQKARLPLLYLNDMAEFRELGGVLIYDELLRRLDAKLVKLQLDTSILRLGYEPLRLFSRAQGRFQSLHLLDWSPERKRTAGVGSGSIDWQALFNAAKAAGVKNYFVASAADSLKSSYAFLHAMKA